MTRVKYTFLKLVLICTLLSLKKLLKIKVNGYFYRLSEADWQLQWASIKHMETTLSVTLCVLNTKALKRPILTKPLTTLHYPLNGNAMILGNTATDKNVQKQSMILKIVFFSSSASLDTHFLLQNMAFSGKKLC